MTSKTVISLIVSLVVLSLTGCIGPATGANGGAGFTNSGTIVPVIIEPAPPAPPAVAAPVPPSVIIPGTPFALLTGSAAASIGNAGSFIWHGGEVEQLGLTRARAVPPARYGLYIYELPGDLVNPGMLVALENFNCVALRRVSSSTPGEATKALMLLPVTSTQTQPEPVDLALSRDFLRVTIGSENARLIYIVITGSPIANPEGAPRTAPAPIVITIPAGIGPAYVTTWLSELRQDIEEGDVASPNAFGLEFSSLLYEIGGVGGIAHLWVQPAEAAVSPSCS